MNNSEKFKKLTNLTSITYINKSTIESLIATAENIKPESVNIRTRSTSERTYYAYERTYLNSPEEVFEAKKNGEEIRIKTIKTPDEKEVVKTYFEHKTNKRGHMDAHIENKFDAGEKYYHLMTVDSGCNFYVTRFWDCPENTIVFVKGSFNNYSITNINNFCSYAVYVPKNAWTLMTRKDYENFCAKTGSVKDLNFGPYCESVYICDYSKLTLKSAEIKLDGLLEEVPEFYLGKPSFKGFDGKAASYKNGEKASHRVLMLSPLMGNDDFPSEQAYVKSFNQSNTNKITRKALNKSMLEKGCFINKYRGDVAVTEEFNPFITAFCNVLKDNGLVKVKADNPAEYIVNFIVENHVDFRKQTIGIRTARKEVDLVEEFEKYISKNN